MSFPGSRRTSWLSRDSPLAGHASSRRRREWRPDQLAFELNGIILAADANFVLHDNPAVLDLARQVVHRRLGLASNGSAEGA